MAVEKLDEFAQDGQKNTDGLTLTDGFPVLTKPARQWFNWLFNTLTLKINEIIDKKIDYENIVDNLTTNDATKPVSAKQAKNLKDSITAIEDIVLYAPIAWPSTTIPSGHLALMGQTISQAQYPKLYALYGPTLPDMRAYSIKGLDYGRGIDSGRTILSLQADQNKSHDHSSLQGTGSFVSSRMTIGSPGSNILSIPQFKITGTSYPENDPSGRSSDLIMPPSGGSETTVKNIAFLYIVKAG